jgi:hypothetical protein
MTTYTVIALVDGVKIGGQSDATYDQVLDLMHDENGVNVEFMRTLMETGHALSVERYKVLPWDKEDTTSVTVAYRNQ